MGAPTRCYSLLVARAPLQGAHTYLAVPGVFATLKPPGYQAETPSASFLPSGWVRGRLAKVCESLIIFIVNVITHTRFCYAGQVNQ